MPSIVLATRTFMEQMQARIWTWPSRRVNNGATSCSQLLQQSQLRSPHRVERTRSMTAWKTFFSENFSHNPRVWNARIRPATMMRYVKTEKIAQGMFKLIHIDILFQQDLLDSSYQADAETDEEAELLAICSCNSTPSSTPKRVNKSPQKSLLSLNCWQSSQPSDSSGNEEVTAEDQDESDAGISDCCQLLNENSSSANRRRSTPRKRATPRFSTHSNNTDDDEDADEEPELLQCAWYQPRITLKAAQEHLQSATPGCFILRRSTPRSFELCLRLEHKVKCYAVQCSRSEMYSLKGAPKQFSTLKALITHHSVMAEQLPLTLDMPREQDLVKTSAMRYADDFEPLESLQLLGILKSLQAKSYEA